MYCLFIIDVAQGGGGGGVLNCINIRHTSQYNAL